MDCDVRSSDGSSVVTVPEVRWWKLPISPTTVHWWAVVRIEDYRSNCSMNLL